MNYIRLVPSSFWPKCTSSFGKNVYHHIGSVCQVYWLSCGLMPVCARTWISWDKVEITGVETAAQVLEAEQKILDILFSGEMTACKLLNDYPYVGQKLRPACQSAVRLHKILRAQNRKGTIQYCIYPLKFCRQVCEYKNWFWVDPQKMAPHTSGQG